MAILEAARGLSSTDRKRGLVKFGSRVLGPEHPIAIFEQMRLGLHLARERYFEEGTALLEEAMEILHRTEGLDTLQGRRVMRWLSMGYVGQGRYSEAEELRTRTAEACRRLMGIENGWTHVQIYHLANLYARQGKWTEAADAYQSFLPHSPVDYGPMSGVFAGITWRLHAAGLLASCLADDSEGSDKLATLILDRYGNVKDPEVAFETAFPLLLTSGSISGDPRVFQLAAFAVGGIKDPLRNAMLSGVGACRRGLWDEAAAVLTPLAGSRDGRVASLSGFFLAMARARSGASQSATSILATANDRLEAMLRSGDLGNALRPGLEWMPFAAAILARNEAEKLIHGQRVSLPIHSDYLRRARHAWKPVGELIDKANWAARRREWAQATDLFLGAMRHEQFDWTAAAHHEPGLEEKIACVLIVGGDVENYRKLREEILVDTIAGQTEYARVVLLSAGDLPARLHARALAVASGNGNQSARIEEPSQGEAWHALTQGMVEYRSSRFGAARSALRSALGAFNLNCSGTANAFAAMTESQLGHSEAAETHLGAAEGSYQQVTGGGDWGRRWSDRAVFMIALEEARSLLNSPSTSATSAQ
jgi:hypothetical protein